MSGAVLPGPDVALCSVRIDAPQGASDLMAAVIARGATSWSAARAFLHAHNESPYLSPSSRPVLAGSAQPWPPPACRSLILSLQAAPSRVIPRRLPDPVREPTLLGGGVRSRLHCIFRSNWGGRTMGARGRGAVFFSDVVPNQTERARRRR
jgi:hypothetical protein